MLIHWDPHLPGQPSPEMAVAIRKTSRYRPNIGLCVASAAQLWPHSQGQNREVFLPPRALHPWRRLFSKKPHSFSTDPPDVVWAPGIFSPVHSDSVTEQSPGSSPTVPSPSPLQGPPPRREGHTGPWASLMRGLLFRRAVLWTSIVDPPPDSTGGTTPLHHSLHARPKPVPGHDASRWN